jgi:hypothetical protein
MMSIQTGKAAVAIAVAAMLGGCSQWQTMDQTSGAVAGAASGAVAGAVVGGPVGAVVGGLGGAYAGYGTTGYGSTPTTGEQQVTAKAASSYDASTVRAVQQALNDRGYNAGPVDGQWSATTRDAVKRFQRASGLPETGELAPSTLSALGVS